MKNKEDVQFVDKVIGALRKTATEIEEVRVQKKVGKAKKQDKTENVKKIEHIRLLDFLKHHH